MCWLCMLDKCREHACESWHAGVQVAMTQEQSSHRPRYKLLRTQTRMTRSMNHRSVQHGIHLQHCGASQQKLRVKERLIDDGRGSRSANLGEPRQHQMRRMYLFRFPIQSLKSRSAAPNPSLGMCSHLSTFGSRPRNGLWRVPSHLPPYAHAS